VKTLNSVRLSPADRVPEAVEHLERTLDRYECAAWVKSDGELVVTLDLQGTSPTQRMAAWRRIVTDALREIDVSVESYA
jgi:hypothetical protein